MFIIVIIINIHMILIIIIIISPVPAPPLAPRHAWRRRRHGAGAREQGDRRGRTPAAWSTAPRAPPALALPHLGV